MKKISHTGAGRPAVSRMVEDIIGCKWSLTVLHLVRRGICRPGAMERSVAGLTAKVLSERLKKLTRYGIIQRTAYAEIPARVEYQLSAFGMQFVKILDAIEALEDETNPSDKQEIN